MDASAAPADEVPLQADMVLLGIEHKTRNDEWLQAYVSRRVPSTEVAVAFLDDRLDFLFQRHLRDGLEAFVSAAYTATTDTANGNPHAATATTAAAATTATTTPATTIV